MYIWWENNVKLYMLWYAHSHFKNTDFGLIVHTCTCKAL